MDSARTMAWFQAVRAVSGLKINQLDRAFGSGTSGMWSRYRIGSISPSVGLIKKVEKVYPHTARYYVAGFWILGTYRIPASAQTIREAMETSLSPDLEIAYISKEATVFWRKPLATRATVRWAVRLMKRSPLDAATLLLTALHQTALAQDAAGFVIAAEGWAKLCHNRHKLPIFGKVFSEFFSRIEEDIYGIMEEHNLFSSVTKIAAHRNDELYYFDIDEEAENEKAMYWRYGRLGKY